MSEITTVLLCLQPVLSTTLFRQLSVISEAMLMMQGRVTMLNISRWTRKGGSYRTLQRFFLSSISWEVLNWRLIKPLLRQQDGVILIAGDATTVTKAGKKTYGLGRFFSSIYSRAVPGIAFQTLSLIDVGSRSSWPILMEQLVPPVKPQKAGKSTRGKVKKRPRGRPKGSKNKNHRDVTLNAEMLQVQSMLKRLLALTGKTLPLTYFVYDGAFGNNAAVQMTRQTDLHLISKLRCNSALYFEWDGVYSGKGRRPRYGKRVDYAAIPDSHLKSDQTQKQVRTRIYQLKGVHKSFADQLNVVIIHKHNLQTGKSARVILFSTDAELGWELVVDYYRLRFQIEFNFRDAKQHWGLEDFMVTRQQAVSNAARLSLFMVNLSQSIMAGSGENSVLDLKARHHGLRYAEEAFKILPQKADVINFSDWVKKIPVLGSIHCQKMAA